MTARLCLVGLVVGFGVEMPEAPDPGSWLEAGREWAQARLTELEARRELVVAPIEEPSPTEEDLSFATLMDEIAAELQTDASGAAPAAPIEAAPPTVLAEASPTLVEATPIFDLPESVWQETAEVEVEAQVEVVEAELEPIEPARAERLAQAIRLTSEAFQAWMSVVVVEAEEDGATR